MLSLLLLVFLVELGAHLVNTIGAATINNLVSLYLSLSQDPRLCRLVTAIASLTVK